MTYNFNLKLLPDDPEHIEESRAKVREDSVKLASDILRESYHKKPRSNVISKRISYLVNDLLVGRFWGVLGWVDGYSIRGGHELSLEEIKKKNASARRWAKNEFTEFSLGKILNVAANQALLRAYEISQPGCKRGHQILYRQFFDTEGTIFESIATDELRIRLNNGRFWEELPERPGVVGEVLRNHFDDLDPEFVPRGLELFNYASSGKNKPAHHSFTFLGEEALDKYAQFLEILREEEALPTNLLDIMVEKYISTVLEWDGDRVGPYYDGDKGYDKDDIRGLFTDKFTVPVVLRRVVQSERVREHVTDILANYLNGGTDTFGQVNRIVHGTITSCPDRQKIMQGLLDKADFTPAYHMIKGSEEAGYPLEEYLPKSF